MDHVSGQLIRLCWVIFLVYWVIAAFFAKRTVQGKGWSRWGWRFPIVVALFIVALLNRGDWMQFSGPLLWTRTAGAALIAGLLSVSGLAITIWARHALAGNWSADVVIKENHELIQRGPYAYVRHPIYSGLLVMGIGAAVFSGKLLAFAAVTMVFSGIWLKARLEERLLTKHFPTAYPAYRKRTGAFLPRVNPGRG